MWLFPCPFHLHKTKAVRCYLYLIVWITLFSLGLYWFFRLGKEEIPYEENVSKHFEYETRTKSLSNYISSEIQDHPKAKSSRKHGRGGHEDDSEEGKTIPETITRLCNSHASFESKDENMNHLDYKLDGVIMLLRHGDRGPLAHVGRHNISHINCQEDHPDYADLLKFTSETMPKIPGYSQFIGPFHSFPKVQANGNQCSLGQLTSTGTIQLLQLGKLIRRTYQSSLLLNESSSSGGGLRVTAYSTRYRRTLQSLVAFLYGLLGPKLIVPSVSIKESQSTMFCFNDCSCRAADRLKKMALKKYKSEPEDKAQMIQLINHLNSVLDVGPNKKTGTSLLDSLLVYPCHKTSLPCRPTPKDATFSRRNLAPFSKKFFSFSNQSPHCISHSDLSSLIDLIQKENTGLRELREDYQYALLSSYGLLKEILGLALRMTSGPSSRASSNNNNIFYRSKLAVFSGHDTTFEALTGALGIRSGHPDIVLPPYASRLIFEFFRKTNVPPLSVRKHFFRLLLNGDDITHLVSFCQNTSIKVETEGLSPPHRFYYELCPLESLVRFLHDNYFEAFGSNRLNFRDACKSVPGLHD